MQPRHPPPCRTPGQLIKLHTPMKNSTTPAHRRTGSFLAGYVTSYLAAIAITSPIINLVTLSLGALVAGRRSTRWTPAYIILGGALRYLLLLAFYAAWRHLNAAPDSSMIWLFFWIGPEIGTVAEKAAVAYTIRN